MKSGNASEVELLAHRCKGASGDLGINAMVKAMERLKTEAASKDLLNAPRLLAEAQEVFALVRKLL